MQEQGFQPWRSLQRHKWGFDPCPQCHPSWKTFWFYYFKQVSQNEVGNCSLKTGTTAVISAKQHMMSEGNLILDYWIQLNYCRFIQVLLPVPVVWCWGLGHAAAPWVVYGHNNPKPRVPLQREVLSHEWETFSTLSSVSYEWKLCNMLRLVQFGAVHLLVWTGTRETVFLFPVFESSAKAIRAFCSLRHSFFRKATREEQQRILPARKRLWLPCQLSKLKLCPSQKCLFRLTSKRKMRAGQGV